MSIRDFLLCVLGTFGGICAMGCWVLTQSDAAYTPQERPTVLAIFVSGVLLFFGMLLVPARSETKKQGTHDFVRRMIFLVGVCGTVTVLFFVATSWGKIFLFGPVPTVLLSVFVLLALLALFVRPKKITGENT